MQSAKCNEITFVRAVEVMVESAKRTEVAIVHVVEISVDRAKCTEAAFERVVGRSRIFCVKNALKLLLYA